MAWPQQTPLVASWLRDIPRDAWAEGEIEWGSISVGTELGWIKWDKTYGLQPTEAELTTASKDPACIAYVAERVDPEKAVKLNAKEYLDETKRIDAIANRAVKAALLAEINELRSRAGLAVKTVADIDAAIKTEIAK